MRLENVVVIAKRESLQRVKSKGFWIATLVLPLFVLAIGILPSLFLAKSKASQKLVVVDETGKVAEPLKSLIQTRQAAAGQKDEKAMREAGGLFVPQTAAHEGSQTVDQGGHSAGERVECGEHGDRHHEPERGRSRSAGGVDDGQRA